MNTPTFYTLDDDHNVVPTKDVMVWAKFFENTPKRIVKITTVGDIEVSTVFVGLDLDMNVFETMIFGGRHDGWTERDATWDGAVARHDYAVGLLKL